MNKLFFSNLLPGTLLFGQFEIECCLSSGNLGGVYLCIDKYGSGGKVALKVLSTPSPNDEELATSFRREMITVNKVSHANVIRARDFFRDEDFTAFSMEYVPGGTLADLLEKRQRLPIDKVINYLSQLCSGLEAIHSSGIVHRDLKAENILVTEDGTLKIADFGIAITRSNVNPVSQSEIIGTMNYLSPEYIESGFFDHRSDIYSLGIIGYELITGCLPFAGKSLIEGLTARVRHDPLPPQVVREECPRELSQAITKAMQRKPDFRFQQASEFLSALKSIGPVTSNDEAEKTDDLIPVVALSSLN